MVHQCNKETEINDIKDSIEIMQKDVRDIRKALLGDEFTPDGYVQKIERMDKRLSVIERFQYKVLVWSVIIVSLGVFFFEIIKIL
jgi:hypothetical protein